MAYKTMLRQLISKWGIMSVQMEAAIEKDMGAINEDGTIDYVDNEEIVEEPKLEVTQQEISLDDIK